MSRKENGELCKRYPKAHLLDADWPERIARIERFTGELPYPTRFTDEGEQLVRRMRLVAGIPRRLDPRHPAQLAQLVALVERMHRAGIVHGDLHPKNLLWDGSQLVIADFEPSLVQLRGYRPCLMATAPFIHPTDARTRRLSRLTDLMCLVRLRQGLSASACARQATQLEPESVPDQYLSRA